MFLLMGALAEWRGGIEAGFALMLNVFWIVSCLCPKWLIIDFGISVIAGELIEIYEFMDCKFSNVWRLKLTVNKIFFVTGM